MSVRIYFGSGKRLCISVKTYPHLSRLVRFVVMPLTWQQKGEEAAPSASQEVAKRRAVGTKFSEDHCKLLIESSALLMNMASRTRSLEGARR